MSETDRESRVGSQIGPYRLRRLLGKGGMGKKPDDRYASAGVLAAAANDALTQRDQDQAATILQRSTASTMRGTPTPRPHQWTPTPPPTPRTTAPRVDPRLIDPSLARPFRPPRIFQESAKDASGS